MQEDGTHSLCPQPDHMARVTTRGVLPKNISIIWFSPMVLQLGGSFSKQQSQKYISCDEGMSPAHQSDETAHDGMPANGWSLKLSWKLRQPHLRPWQLWWQRKLMDLNPLANLTTEDNVVQFYVLPFCGIPILNLGSMLFPIRKKPHFVKHYLCFS